MISEILKKIVTSKCYALFVLMLISGWIHLVGLSVDNFGRTTISYTAIFIQLLAYFLAGVGVLCDWAVCAQILKKSWFWVLFVIFSSASLLWADDLYFSATRLVGMLGVVAIALLLASRFSVSVFLHWMVGFSLIFCVINYGFIFLYPEISKQSTQVWKGFFANPNQLGLTVIIFVVIVYTRLIVEKMCFKYFLFILIITLPLIYFGHSMLANIALICAILTISMLWWFYKFDFHIVWLWFVLFIVVIVVCFCWKDILLMLGNPSISGRVVIWDLFYDQIKTAPYLGHGYGALAETDIHLVKDSYTDLSQIVVKMAPYYGNISMVDLNMSLLEDRYAKFISIGAHNGYLDLLFWFGWFGFSLFTLFLVDITRKIQILLSSKYNKESVFFLTVFVVMFLIVNLTESLILVRSGLFWTIFVYVIFKVNEVYDEFCKSVPS